MDIKERAKEFAILAHQGQFRKSEPDKPMVTHPICVGMILEEYGYDDAVIAAGYLHDVVEDTEYTIEDIETQFGADIADLVKGDTEPDKNLSWEERKQHTIDKIKNMPLRNKVVVAADKINNLEDLLMQFQRTGKRDFSIFKRGEEKQKWYFENIYQSITNNEDKDLPIFKRLKELLDIVFRDKKNHFLENIFSDDEDYYKKLESLHAKKIGLLRLKQISKLSKPFIIEFCGTPRSGKTTILNNLYDFFKKGGYNITLVEELIKSNYYKESLSPQMKKMSLAQFNIEIIKEVEKQLLEAASNDSDIVLIDRSLNDRAIWNHRVFTRGHMNEKQYKETIEKYSQTSKELIDMLVIWYTDPLTSLRRDYKNSLALEERKFLNHKNIEEYNHSMNKSIDLFKNSVNNIYKIDTTNISPNESSILIADNIMSIMRKKYIKNFNQKYYGK